jgi:hypothetical protein
MNAEGRRLAAARSQAAPWRKWGPYLSERQWGTVREDYGSSGDAWSYLSHDNARSFAYRWGEDGIAGVSDDRQILCFALALWNGRDPILKERMFGLTNHEGNHGEDVKEYYFYLDSTPTHSYMRYLYKYPQAAFPYVDLVETNRGRSRGEREYELIDSRIFTADARGRRPVFGAAPKFNDDRLWRDNLLFYEYFNGDNGAGIGASHQTGWTGLIPSLLHYFATISPTEALNLWAPPHAAPAAASSRRTRRKTPEPERRT